MKLRVFALAGACGLAGSVGGYVLGRGERTQAVEAASVFGARPPAAPPRVRSALACPSTAQGPSGDPESSALQVAFCEARLAECQRQRTAVRQPWPTDSPLESPEAWQRAVEEAIDRCDIASAEFELIDCKEYPCMAAFRPKQGEPGRDLTEERHRLRAEFRECAPLREALGVQTEQERRGIDVFSFDAQCPDERREPLMILSALAPQGPLARRFDRKDRTKAETKDLSRLHFRRADDVIALWPCSD